MMARGGLTMNFKVAEVLNTLRKNRAEHAKIVEEAVRGYREKFRAELVGKLHDLDSDRLPDTHSKLSKPQSYLTEYDSAIQMLEMTTDETLELDQSAFQCYVQNKWSWMSGFLSTNSLYSGSAAAAVGSAVLSVDDY